MIEHGFTPEQVVHVSQAALGLWALAQAYSPSQRGAIIYRDGKQCQMDCEAAKHCGKGKGKNQVHHVRPQRWMADHGMPPHEIDSARNGITVCEEFHQKEIHGLSKSEVQRRLRAGQPYWDTNHDMRLAQKAEENTQKAERKGWRFPGKGKTKKLWSRK